MNIPTILVVENELLVAQDIQLTLKRLGFSVPETVRTGEEALSSVAYRRPDLVMMDIHLAGAMDGISAATEIMNEFNVPVIFLSSYTDKETVDRAKSSSPYGYIAKPFDEITLRLTIEIALYKHEVELTQKISDEKFKRIVHSSTDGILLTDESGMVIEWNESQERISGIPREAALGKPLVELVPDIDPSVQLREISYRHSDGTEVTAQITTFPIRTRKGEQIGAISRDVTEQRRAKELERRHRKELSILYSVSKQLNGTADFHETIRIVLENATRALGADAGTILLANPPVRQKLHSVGLETTLSRTINTLCEASHTEGLKACRLYQDRLYQLSRTDETAEICPIFATGRFKRGLGMPLHDDGNYIGHLFLFRTSQSEFSKRETQFLETLVEQNITALRKAELIEETRQMAFIDSLTRIYNRHALFSRGVGEFERARRYGSPLSVMMIDTDHFKDINDSKGHVAGDLVLRQVADILKSRIREVDILGRYGGEEFALILPNTDRVAALELAERLREQVEDKGKPVPTISIGVAVLENGIGSFSDLVEQADRAMYKAKKRGRNRVEVL